jgi:hypothetical protein
MRPSQKKTGISARSPKVAKKQRQIAARRVAKRAKGAAERWPSRAKRFVQRHPIPVILGVSAIGFVLTTLKKIV